MTGPPRIGSLCSGYGGLDLAAMAVVGGSAAWHCDIAPEARSVLEHHYPGVPNLGDIIAVDWDDVEDVDVVTAGYPCTPFSVAGRREGEYDARHLWPYVAAAVAALRPQLFIGENVRGHLSLGFGAVLADLSALGYDIRWVVVSASDVGAPHLRARVFILAEDRRGKRDDRVRVPRRDGSVGDGAAAVGRDGGGVHGTVAVGRRSDGRDRLRHTGATVGGSERRHWDAAGAGRTESTDGDLPAADTAGVGRGERRPESARILGGSDASLGCDGAAADTDCDPLRQQPVSIRGGCRATVVGRPVYDWGDYAPAIERWELTLGRAAPAPTVTGKRGGQQLSPVFVEWMMGLSAGWVTGVPGLPRGAQLKLLGNGVVPQQAARALRWLSLPPGARGAG